MYHRRRNLTPYMLCQHILQETAPHNQNLRKETKVMVCQAVCITTLHERGVGYILMSYEYHGEIPPTLPQKDSLYPMGRSPHQRQYPYGGQHY